MDCAAWAAGIAHSAAAPAAMTNLNMAIYPSRYRFERDIMPVRDGTGPAQTSNVERGAFDSRRELKRGPGFRRRFREQAVEIVVGMVGIVMKRHQPPHFGERPEVERLRDRAMFPA